MFLWSNYLQHMLYEWDGPFVDSSLSDIFLASESLKDLPKVGGSALVSDVLWVFD